MSENTNNNYESKVRKVLFNEVTFIIAIVSLVSGVIFWVQNPQAELKLEIVKLNAKVENYETVTSKLQNIKDNDLHELQLKMDRIEKNQIEIMKSITKLETLINKK